MKLNNKKLFIFDWSGVISDDRRPVYEANMRLLEKYGRPTFSFEKWLPETVMTVVHFARNHNINDPENIIVDTYQKYLNEAIENGNKPTIVPGSKEILESLKIAKKKIALLSSHPVENLEKEVDEFGLRKYFDFISGGALDKIKSLRQICEKLGFEPKQAVYIGDMISDIQSAKGAGMGSIAVYTGYHIKEKLEKENPVCLIRDLGHLSKLLR